MRAKSLKYIKLEILSTFATSSQSQSTTLESKSAGSQQQTYLNQIMLYRADAEAVQGHGNQPGPSIQQNDQQQLETLLQFQPLSDDASIQNHNQPQQQPDLQLFGYKHSGQ